MTKLNVNLETFLESFFSLEKTVVKIQTKNSRLELALEDSSRALKHGENKEKALAEERDSLLETVKQLQQNLEAQCNIRVENERLDDELKEMKKLNAKKAEEAEAEVQTHVAEMRAAAERHQGALEDVRLQSRREVEEAHSEAAQQMEAQTSEAKQLLEEMERQLQEMTRRLREQEKEHHSHVHKLQMEFGAKLARVQSSAQMSQQQQQQSSPYQYQNIFKRKLQFFQEEKNKEVAALRQRIKELEEGQLTGLKRRKVSFNL